MASCNKGCVTELDRSNLLWLNCIDSLAQVASHGCVPLQIYTHIHSQGGTRADEHLIDMQTVFIPHLIPRVHALTQTQTTDRLCFSAATRCIVLYCIVTVFRLQPTARGSHEETGCYTGGNQGPDQSGTHADTRIHLFLSLTDLYSFLNKNNGVKLD